MAARERGGAGTCPAAASPRLAGEARIIRGAAMRSCPTCPCPARASPATSLARGAGAAPAGARRDRRAEMRNLRSIIAELEPKLREALKDAQMASRRERTAVTQLAHAKAAMDKKHGKAVEELMAAVAAAEERALDASAECRQLHEVGWVWCGAS